MKILKSQKGISLIEILAGIPLATLVFAIFTISVLHFVTTFEETKLYTQLQEDLFNAIETMRYGYAYEYHTDGEGLIGLMTADTVSISTSRNTLKIRPIVVNQTLKNDYWCTFTLNNNNQLEVYAKYGLKPSFPDRPVIFPSTPIKMIGREPRFKILNRGNIWSIEKTDAYGKPLMIKIELKGQVRFRERRKDQSREDDVRQNIRIIKYETSVFLGNAYTEG
jgi:type II secretory pathway pseudopilin PulG